MSASTHRIRLVVDHREGALGEHIRSTSILAPITEFAALPVADILLYDGEEVAFAMERKTYSDLVQSVKDGRYREQKARLLATFPASKIVYVLEGVAHRITYDPVQPDEKIATGCVLNTMLRDGVRIMYTAHVLDTCQFLEQCVMRLQKEGWSGGAGGAAAPSYASVSLKPNKKDNLDPATCFLHQLSQVPGLSVSKASRLVEHFGWGSMRDMIVQMEGWGDARARIRQLSQAPGIGAKLSQTLLNFLGAGEGGNS